MTTIASSAKAIPSLTGVRGIAAVWVFFTHYYMVMALLLDWPELKQNQFFFNGFRGVDLFFILSGFILMYVHADEFGHIDKACTVRFYILRFFRVYPLNTVVLFIMVPFVLTHPEFVAHSRTVNDEHYAYMANNYTLAGFIQSLFLAQTWTILKLGEWNIVAWTLSAEVLGYAIFPLIAWLLVRERSGPRCILYAALSLACLTILLFIFHHADNNPTGTFGAVRMMFCFFCGACLYRGFALMGDRFSAYASLLTILSILFVVLTMFWPWAPVLDSFGFAVLIFGLSYQQGPVNRLLSDPAAVFLGKISFSFYLIHFLIIKFFSWVYLDTVLKQTLSVKLAVLFALPLFCIIVAYYTYIWIEKPFQRLGRKAALRVNARHADSAPAKQSLPGQV